VDPGYRPRVAIIMLAYDEAQLIEGKFDNVYEQDYPKDGLEKATGIGLDIHEESAFRLHIQLSTGTVIAERNTDSGGRPRRDAEPQDQGADRAIRPKRSPEL